MHSSGQRAVYSNNGAQVDITAPGGDSSLGSGTYAIGSTWNTGTSLDPLIWCVFFLDTSITSFPSYTSSVHTHDSNFQ